MNKKFIIFILLLTIGIILLIVTYMNFWREPRTQYRQTGNIKLQNIRKDLNELKADLRKKGEYNCCIRNDCNWCALYMEHCPCADIVTKEGNEKSCPECAAAWNRKQGKIPGADPDAIEVTTFGIYGYEKEGHHYSEGKAKRGNDYNHHGNETEQHNH